MDWKDCTTFSKGETDRTPRVWKIAIGKMTIVLHRHIHYGPDDWLLTCNGFFDNKLLESVRVDEAKLEAIDLVYQEVKKIYEDIEKYLDKQSTL